MIENWEAAGGNGTVVSLVGGNRQWHSVPLHLYNMRIYILYTHVYAFMVVLTWLLLLCLGGLLRAEAFACLLLNHILLGPVFVATVIS